MRPARSFSTSTDYVEIATDSALVAVIGAESSPDMDRMLQALHALPDADAAVIPPSRFLCPARR